MTKKKPTNKALEYPIDSAEKEQEVRLPGVDVQETVDKIEQQRLEIRTMLQSLKEVVERTDNSIDDFRGIAELFAAAIEKVETERAALVAREVAVLHAEERARAQFAEEILECEREVGQRKQRALSDLDSEISRIRVEQLELMNNQIKEERERQNEDLLRQRQDFVASIEAERVSLQKQALEIEIQRGTLSALQTELEGRRVELDESEAELERRSQRMNAIEEQRRVQLENEVVARISEERKSFLARIESATLNADAMRSQLRSQDELLSTYDDLRRQLGGREPAAVIAELRTLATEVARQREELASRPSEELRLSMDALERERVGLSNRVAELNARLQQQSALVGQATENKLKVVELEAISKSLEREANIWKSSSNSLELENQNLRVELDRLRTAPPEQVEARYQEIEMPRLNWDQLLYQTQPEISELDWLAQIETSCDEHGLHFSSRIIKAFHTALKTAEWSPITVLAGVSGTGKSQLPELYSHFGGLYFQALAVQPNWDSQESMLGYFNSIDNKFDAQPVLRFLAQSQKSFSSTEDEAEGYPGLNAAMCMILLDEMNLAHPELYFAEFLSKLEQRRGATGNNIPKLDVKVGAGMRPYELPLGRNVLWVGTMNEDETTKSLSDKVLDRSTVIYFPRPSSLRSRTELKTLGESNRGPELPREMWNSWKENQISLSSEELDPYRSFVEKINKYLSFAGRAVGHRVWQSIEYYMANYPDVRASADDPVRRSKALHIAFEDQIAQKIMPKLRGIDTRGSSLTNCLEPIRTLLQEGVEQIPFDLLADFERSMDLGYGQFIWKSADYLKEKDVSEAV